MIESNDIKVIGADILPGENPQKGVPYFSVVIISGNKILKKEERVNIRELLRLVRSIKPKFLAIDNVFELASNKRELKRLLLLLSLHTSVVQVTKAGNKEIPILKLAENVGIKIDGKLTPSKTAEIAALLAIKGIGSIASVIENETEIIVARGRSPGSGGMSAKRFERNINLLILRKTKEIKSFLDKNNIDYDLFSNKGENGLKSSLFLVYAPRQRLYGVVREERGHDLRVILHPVIKKDIEFIPINKTTNKRKAIRPLILGIDPGIETGVAILNLSGEVLLLLSRRELSRNKLVDVISKYGIPVLVATDVNSPSDYVKKVASFFNAALFYPSKPLSVLDKRKIVQNYCNKYKSIKVNTPHQRDALASAIKAFESLSNKFEKIEKETDKLNLSKQDIEEIKTMVIKGKTLKDAINEISQRNIQRKTIIPKNITIQYKSNERILEDLKRKINKIKELENKIELLREENKKKDKRIKELEFFIKRSDEKTLEKIKKDKKIVTLTTKINMLKEEIQSLKEKYEEIKEKNTLLNKTLIKLFNKSALMIPIIDNLNDIRDWHSDIFYVNDINKLDISKIKDLSKKKASLISRKNASLKIKNLLYFSGVPIITISNDEVMLKTDKIAIVSADILDKISNAKKELRRYIASEDQITRLLRRYRENRRKILKDTYSTSN